MNKTLYLFVFHIFSPLLVGALLYVWKGNCLNTVTDIPSFFVYQLPDALWAYAFCSSLLLIWRNKNAALVAFGAFCLCAFYEFMQYAKWTAGTFDKWDVLVMAMACVMAYFLLGHRRLVS